MGDEEQKPVVPDAPWLVLQKKIFGRYVAQQLRNHNIKVEINDIVEDLKDGTLLISLVEVLSGKELTPKPKPAKVRIQQVANVTEALKFVKSVGIKSNCAPEDIVDGKANFVLGLVFAVIIKYLKLDEDDAASADIKEALLLWLKNKTAGYSNISIENYTKSFQDGLVFNALIHKMRPKLIPYDTLDPANKIQNLTLALDTAAKYCNVEKYLNPEDIANLDEIGMVVYLYDWYYGVSLLQKQDIAARRIGKLADMTKLHDQMKADYKSQANALVAWIGAKIADLNKRDIDNTMGGIRAKLDKFYGYKSKEKGEKIVHNLDLNALFDNLALRLRNNNRPPFVLDHNPDFLQSQFDALEKAESECSVFLHTELERQIRLDTLGKRFRADAGMIETWIGEKLNYANTTESIDSVDLAKYHLVNHSQIETEVQAQKNTRVAALHKLQEELAGEKYEFSSELKGIADGVDSKFAALEAAFGKKKTALEAELERQKKINDDLCKAFAEAVKSFSSWIQKTKESVNDKAASLETLLNLVDKTLNSTGEVDGLLAAVNAAGEKVRARLITINPYTNVTSEDAQAQWNQLQLLLTKKKDLLVQEIENSKRSGLTEEQIREVNDNFNYFDKDKSGFLEKRELRACLQSLGEESNPTHVQELITQHQENGNGKISKAGFTQMMLKRLGDSNTKEEILQGFSYLSLEKETIPAELLEAVVNELTFKTHHVEYLKKEMKQGAGGLDYKTWTEEVFAR
jgi:Ca2+-binding EF-hand superfamily protein